MDRGIRGSPTSSIFSAPSPSSPPRGSTSGVEDGTYLINLLRAELLEGLVKSISHRTGITVHDLLDALTRIGSSFLRHDGPVEVVDRAQELIQDARPFHGFALVRASCVRFFTAANSLRMFSICEPHSSQFSLLLGLGGGDVLVKLHELVLQDPDLLLEEDGRVRDVVATLAFFCLLFLLPGPAHLAVHQAFFCSRRGREGRRACEERDEEVWPRHFCYGCAGRLFDAAAAAG